MRDFTHGVLRLFWDRVGSDQYTVVAKDMKLIRSNQKKIRQMIDVGCATGVYFIARTGYM
jgi:predicted TPR repeat methyltransferase